MAGIRDLVAARIKELGLNKREVSLKLGLNHAYIQQFIERGTPVSLPEEVRGKLAEILGVQERLLKAGAIGPSLGSDAGKIHNSQKATADSIPVLGMAEGGKDGWEMWNGEVVAYVPRPVVLAGVPKAYGVYAAGSSMEPRYYPGELLYINPGKPPQIGNFVLIELHPTEPGEGPRAIIKRLVKRTMTKTVLEQFTPAKLIEIKNDEIKSIHRIVGSADA